MRRRLAFASLAGLAIAAIGVVFLVTTGVSASGTFRWTLVFVVTLLALLCGVISGVFALVLPIFGRSADPAELADAAATGREGFARVLRARPTGAKINGTYVYDADLVVNGTGAPPYRATDRVRVPRAEGALRGGEIVTVVRLRPDSGQVAVVAGPARTPQDASVPLDAPPWP
jgi:hypothetical protein